MPPPQKNQIPGYATGDSTDVILSDNIVLNFNPPKLCYVPGNTLVKRSASYFIHTNEHLIIYSIFTGKLHCCNSTFTYVLFEQLLAKNI